MLPNDPHDLALWLLDTLEDVRSAGGTLWEGRLPAELNFADTVSRVEAAGGSLGGISNEGSRVIGFHPSIAGVYRDLDELIGVARNRRIVRNRFAIRSPKYHHPATGQQSTPDDVAAYIAAVDLWVTLERLADIPANNSIHFVASHDAQLEIRADFTVTQLRALPSLDLFAAEFTQPPHEDQKRAVIRSTLTDHFKPSRFITLGELLGAFESIASDARRSLAMYMAEFSVKKVLDEVGRQNLEDSLSLGKTISDIQNQLLALPAAMLLAGATIKAEESLRNWAVLLGMIVFCVLYWVLVWNQWNSVEAIDGQIRRRKDKVGGMPIPSRDDALRLFDPLISRVARQRFALAGIAVVVGLATVFTIVAVLDANLDGVASRAIADGWSYFKESLARIWLLYWSIVRL